MAFRADFVLTRLEAKLGKYPEDYDRAKVGEGRNDLVLHTTTGLGAEYTRGPREAQRWAS
jgi:hypothetical protein